MLERGQDASKHCGFVIGDDAAELLGVINDELISLVSNVQWLL